MWSYVRITLPLQHHAREMVVQLYRDRGEEFGSSIPHLPKALIWDPLQGVFASMDRSNFLPTITPAPLVRFAIVQKTPTPIIAMNLSLQRAAKLHRGDQELCINCYWDIAAVAQNPQTDATRYRQRETQYTAADEKKPSRIPLSANFANPMIQAKIKCVKNRMSNCQRPKLVRPDQCTPKSRANQKFQMSQKHNIVWFKRDLRANDNASPPHCFTPRGSRHSSIYRRAGSLAPTGCIAAPLALYSRLSVRSQHRVARFGHKIGSLGLAAL